MSDGHPLIPCKSCPWRIEATAAAIPGFRPVRAVGLLETASRGQGDGLRKIMACHGANPVAPHACRGYLARDGWTNLNVRILLGRGQIAHPDAVRAACEAAGITLEPDYPAVLAKLRRPPAPPCQPQESCHAPPQDEADAGA